MLIRIAGSGIHAREVFGVGKLRGLPLDWYAYTNLELIQPGAMPRQVDIVIVLEDRIVIVDLKDWHGTITSDGQHWIQNGKVKDPSPVTKILENARTLATLLGNHVNPSQRGGMRDTVRVPTPLIEGCVVMTAPCDISGLPQMERSRVFPVDEFCRFIKNPKEREQVLAPSTWLRRNPRLTADGTWHSRLDSFFAAPGRYFNPIEKTFGDYKVVSDAVFEHPKALYREYDAEESSASRASGLLRLWDFSKADGRYAAEEARVEIAGREQNVVSYLADRQPELETVLLRPRIAEEAKSIHYWEVFERRRQLKRLGQFLLTHEPELTPAIRFGLVRNLLSHVASMHRVGAAHLDLGVHSVWMELPSNVRLSHLVAAYYPELVSLGSRRFEFLAGGVAVPKQLVADSGNHLRKDVYLLGVISHTVLLGKPPDFTTSSDDRTLWASPDMGTTYESLLSWFKSALEVSPTGGFADAQEMLDAFNAVLAAAGSDTSAIERLQRYRKWKSIFDVARNYPQTVLLRETDRKLVWMAETAGTRFLVKAWRRTCWKDETTDAPRLIRFCEAAENLMLGAPAGIAQIVDVGFISDHLVLVQQYEDSANLQDHVVAEPGAWADKNVALSFINKLLQTVASLHDSGRSHGDIKPANILVRKCDDGLQPILIDLLDFGPGDEGEIITPAYTPSFPASTPERDRFAVLKITEEILFPCDLQGEAKRHLKAAIACCREQHPPLSTLAPVAEIVERLLLPAPTAERAQITIRHPTTKVGLVTSDEGRYYIRLRSNDRQNRRTRTSVGTLLLTIVGAHEELELSLEADGTVRGFTRRFVSQGIIAIAERNPRAIFVGEITVRAGSEDFSEVSAFLSSLPPQEPGLTELTQIGDDSVEVYTTGGLVEDGVTALAVESLATAPIDVPSLWKTLLQVEEEQIIRGIADADSTYSKERRRHFIPFVNQMRTFDFDEDDTVRVEVTSARTGRWVGIGSLDLSLTRNDLLAVEDGGSGTRNGVMCRARTELRLSSKMEADSRTRRTDATNRILERRSAIPTLVDYFRPEVKIEPTFSGPELSRESVIAKYDLNEPQADAFIRIWRRRPLGLLQGPPGTGKTRFIAALMHHGLSTGSIRNVLLASQSNEAVNNAAEEVLKLFRRNESEPSLVRIGQEGDVSEILKPYHSAKVEAKYRDQFRAGLKERFAVAGKHLGVPDQFAADLFYLESTVRPAFQQLQVLLQGQVDQNVPPNSDRRIQTLFETLARLEESLQIDDWHADWNSPEAYDSMIAAIAAKRRLSSADVLKKMRGLAALMRDWMGSVSSRRRSFEEFLAKTRQIVAGTCVGLGRSSLGIASAGFDLVVIDEAARCTPSELAVPMQAGRWIVLVGDHFQLEPFHELRVVVETRRRLSIPPTEIVRSDFDRAFSSSYGKSVGEKLTYQYRMLPSIGALVSDVFYRGELKHCRTEPLLPPDIFPDELASELIWFKTDELGVAAYQKEERKRGRKSLFNLVEANVVVDVLRKLDCYTSFTSWLAGLPEGTQPVGIICTYAAQRELIRAKIHAVGISGALQRACKVDTVDSYQGKQNPIVILSLVRNNEDGPNENGEKTIAQGFMARGNRINVALSRAMDKLVIVGASSRWPSDGPMSEVAQRFVKLAEAEKGVRLEAASQQFVTDDEATQRKKGQRSKRDRYQKATR